MGISSDNKNCCCNNDHDFRSLPVSGLFLLFTHLLFVGFGVREVLACCWQASQFPLMNCEAYHSMSEANMRINTKINK
jgi:hypothetical protein